MGATRIIREQTKTNPVLSDYAIGKINAKLKDRLWWLDQTFGRAWPITRVQGNKRYTEPCVYTAGNNKYGYETLVPSADLGNYSFFVLKDPTALVPNKYGMVRIPFSLIVWVDLRTCFQGVGADKRRDTENLKRDILSVLKNDVFFTGGAITIAQVYEEAKNVFKGFTIDETTNQCLMQPYAGFRFDGEVSIMMECV